MPTVCVFASRSDWRAYSVCVCQQELLACLRCACLPAGVTGVPTVCVFASRSDWRAVCVFASRSDWRAYGVRVCQQE